MNKMIFLAPYKVISNGKSASSIRPYKMLEEFRKKFEVFLIDGDKRNRFQRFKELELLLKEGVKFDFLYMENHTMPSCVTDKQLKYFFVDYLILKIVKTFSIPTSVFYRDIYWIKDDFGFKKVFGFIKSNILRQFYRYEFRQFNKWINVMYLPNKSMLDYLPAHNFKVEELPPGAPNMEPNDIVKNKKGFIYVGGIGNHYKMQELFRAFNNRPQAKLTMCIRKNDWVKVKSEYMDILSDNITIKHLSGNQLTEELKRNSFGLILVEPSEYWSFAVPFKLFEYVSCGLKVLATEKTATGDIVNNYSIGLTTEYNTSKIINLIDQAINDNKDYEASFNRFLLDNSWTRRVDFVTNQLSL